jgi:hypothetical protein
MENSSFFFERSLDECLTSIIDHGESVEACLRQHEGEKGELEPLLRLAVTLQSASRVSAPPDFHQAASARMQNMIAAHPRREPAPAQPTSVLSWFTQLWHTQVSMPAVLAVLVISALMLFTGAAYASSASLPGDSLYNFKLWLEDTQVSFALSQQQAIQYHMEFANRRLTEAAILTQGNRTQDISRSLDEYREQLDSSLDLLVNTQVIPSSEKQAIATELQQELEQHEANLKNLQENTEPAISAQIATAIENVNAGLVQVSQLLSGGKLPEGLETLPAMWATLSTSIPLPTFATTPSPEDTNDDNDWSEMEEMYATPEEEYAWPTPTGEIPSEWQEKILIPTLGPTEIEKIREILPTLQALPSAIPLPKDWQNLPEIPEGWQGLPNLPENWPPDDTSDNDDIPNFPFP